MAVNPARLPLGLPDKPGQGKLWEDVRRLSNDFIDAVNSGDKHEAGRLEQRLARARKQFHALHGKQVRSPQDDSR